MYRQISTTADSKVSANEAATASNVRVLWVTFILLFFCGSFHAKGWNWMSAAAVANGNTVFVMMCKSWKSFFVTPCFLNRGNAVKK